MSFGAKALLTRSAQWQKRLSWHSISNGFASAQLQLHFWTKVNSAQWKSQFCSQVINLAVLSYIWPVFDWFHQYFSIQHSWPIFKFVYFANILLFSTMFGCFQLYFATIWLVSATFAYFQPYFAKFYWFCQYLAVSNHIRRIFAWFNQ